MIDKIVFRNVHKTFTSASKTVEVLKDVNLTITKGDQLVIIGSSGSGKSTLLSLIGAIELPTRGEVWYDNQNIMNTSPQERIHLRRNHFGFVFQNFALINWLTVTENLDHILLIHGIKDVVDRSQRVSTLLAKVKLQNRADYFPPELSGGEKQRVALVRAMVTNPSIILADEPTGRLDFENTIEIWDSLTHLVQESNCTLIVFTHDARINFLQANIRLFLLEYGHLKALN